MALTRLTPSRRRGRSVATGRSRRRWLRVKRGGWLRGARDGGSLGIGRHADLQRFPLAAEDGDPLPDRLPLLSVGRIELFEHAEQASLDPIRVFRIILSLGRIGLITCSR